MIIIIRKQIFYTSFNIVYSFSTILIYIFNNSVDSALNAQNRKLPCERPEKLYTTYLENKYKLFVGTPKWAELEKKEADDLDSDILKVPVSLTVSVTRSQYLEIILTQ